MSDRLQSTREMSERFPMPGIRENLRVMSRRWRTAALPIMQSALAAGVSWLIAVHVLDHRVPFFAPIAAVICLGTTLGQRLRRGIELVTGVAIGSGSAISWRPLCQGGTHSPPYP